MIVSIDPGDTTGIALWSDEGVFLEKTKMALEEFVDWADELDSPVSVVVVEDYVQDPFRRLNRKGSKMKASQGIGVARALAKRKKAKLVVQKNTILDVAAMHSGTKVVQHYSDDVSAYLHGFYYLESKGIRRPVLQERTTDE